jgi:MFS family permease
MSPGRAIATRRAGTAAHDAGARDVRLLAFAVGVSAAGDLLAIVTLALYVHELTGSGLAVSALFAATMVPVVLLAPVAGMIADRFESSRVLLVASLAQAVVATALVFAGGLAPILVLCTLLAAGAAVAQPAEFALVPAAAGKERLAAASGTMEAARYLGFAAGPILGAALVAAGGTGLALAVNAASFTAVAVAAALIRTRRRPEPSRSRHERASAGARHLLGDPVLRPLVLAAVGALVFISACMTAEVFYVKDDLGAGDAVYALLMGTWMIGMVAGAAALPRRVPKHVMAATALVALAVQGAGVAGQTVWAVIPMAAIGYVIGGVGHGLKNTLIRTVIAARVPRNVHGRAFAAYNAARNAAELGALAGGGLLVTAVGARQALLIAGLGPVIAGLAGLAAMRRSATPIRERRTSRRPAAPRAPSAAAAGSPPAGG